MKAIWRGKTIADSDGTLEVGGYRYFPRDTVRIDLLQAAPKTPRSRMSAWRAILRRGRKRRASPRAAWSYEAPQPKMKPVDRWMGFWEDVEVK